MSNPSELRHVLVIEDQKSRRIVHLVDSRYDIGRDPQSTIPLFDRQSSRHHATLVRVNDYANNCHSYRLIDGNLQGQKSSNGLLVNGRRTPSHELKHGDCIQFSHQAKASYHLIATASDLVSLQAQYPLRYSPPPSELRSPPAEQADTVVPPDFAPFSEDKEKAAVLPIVPTNQSPIQRSQPPSSGESSPYPLIELDFSGRVIYLNPAASTTFPNLSQATLDHPLLKGLLNPSQPRESPSFVREVQVDQAFFEQNIFYFPDSGIIRCYVQDITRYHNLLQRYKRRKERFILFDRQGTEGIFLVSTNHKQVIETNQVFCDFVGYRAKDLLTMDLYQLMTLVDRDTIDRELEKVTPDLPLLLEESFYRRQDGSLVGFSVKVSQVVYLERAVYCFVVQAIRDRKTQNDPLSDDNLSDPLTQLPNQTFLEQQLSLALDHAARHRHLMAVLFINLDSFKSINSPYGRGVRDQVLKEVGVRLKSLIKPRDTLARWEGDKFCLLLTQLKHQEEPAKLAQSILDSLLQPFEIDSQAIQISSSIGITLYPQDGEEADILIKKAEATLDLTQQQGTNHYQFYNVGLVEATSQLAEIESLLQQAMVRLDPSQDSPQDSLQDSSQDSPLNP